MGTRRTQLGCYVNVSVRGRSFSGVRSGWAWGQDYLANGVVAVEAKVGKGTALLYTPQIIMRGLPHQTFKLLFNGIYYSVMQ